MKKTFKFAIWNLPEIIAAIGLLISIGMTFYNVITRYFFKHTFAGISEIITLSFVWMVFMGAAAAYKRKMHYGIDMLVNRFHGKKRMIIDFIVLIIMLIITYLGTHLSFVLANSAWEKIMAATRIPYTFFYFAATSGFVLMFIYTILMMIKDIKRIKGKMTIVEGDENNEF